MDGELGPDTDKIAVVRFVALGDLVGKRDRIGVAGIQGQLGHHLGTLMARDGEDGELVLSLPGAIVVEIPYGGLDTLRFSSGVVGAIEDETPDGVEASSSQVGLCAGRVEPWG